ncbi:DUF4176 domain-containing protein [Clostridium botulinum]|uniref:DUF4176 domain-containing protein n=1 Tax=Clostridium botulinum TaxID=1491 RepID=UPI0013CDDB23|nr:DUF4176 domain-containing protein [Clostridium botulinum]MBD5631364.1 DUF4176 domain-containing protein [Clostridium botulinum]MBD5645740.1 DUF4176 domain-containing protein [Clostridium botulinum]NFE18457.1 DUF4176 domain-containing protein [Clostridium botulinum]
MKDILLNIGSIVEVEYQGEIQNYLIVGKRVINFNSMKAWDYYSVPYPEGSKKDSEGKDDNGFYFNHTDIEKIIYTCNIDTEIENKS